MVRVEDIDKLVKMIHRGSAGRGQKQSQEESRWRKWRAGGEGGAGEGAGERELVSRWIWS